MNKEHAHGCDEVEALERTLVRIRELCEENTHTYHQGEFARTILRILDGGTK